MGLDFFMVLAMIASFYLLYQFYLFGKLGIEYSLVLKIFGATVVAGLINGLIIGNPSVNSFINLLIAIAAVGYSHYRIQEEQ